MRRSLNLLELRFLRRFAGLHQPALVILLHLLGNLEGCLGVDALEAAASDAFLRQLRRLDINRLQLFAAAEGVLSDLLDILPYGHLGQLRQVLAGVCPDLRHLVGCSLNLNGVRNSD